TVRSVVELATAKKATVVLVAPTGRAAKRLAELTGHPAATVHRLLELQPGGDPGYDRDNPLDADLVVVDESSMMDVVLANKLVRAIPPAARLLMVGDVAQLPSVGRRNSQAHGGHRRLPHPRQIRARPGPRHSGADPDPPRPGRGGQPQRPAPAGPHPPP